MNKRKEPILTTSKPAFFDGTGEIHEMDAVELVGNLPNESVDLVIFDPAYQSLEKWRKLGTTTRLKKSKGSSNEWFDIFPNAGFFPLFGHLQRVMKPGTHLYMFCDEETRDMVCVGFSPQTGEFIEKSVDGLRMTDPAGAPAKHFKIWKSIVWDKVTKGMGYHYPAQHELILFMEKVLRKNKHRQLNTNKIGDVMSVKMLKGKKYYPTEKPAPLIWTLINESSNKGDVVLDMFSGSGVVGQLCQRMGRYFILGDVDAKETIRRIENKVDLSQ